MVRKDLVSSFGGWTLEPVLCVGDRLPQKLVSGFYKAFDDLTGALYTPLVYCGSQVVNGTNYMFICKVVYTTSSPKTAVAKVVLHETLPSAGLVGEFSIFSIETIVEEAAEGGYKLLPFPYMPGELTSDPIAKAFELALDGFDGSKIEPLAFCGTQFISPGNSNNMFICKNSVTGSEEVSHIDAVVLNEKDKVFTLSAIIEIV